MSDLKARLQEAARNISAVDSTDLSKDTGSSTQNILWPEGVYRGRVCEVIELGVQKQDPFQGQAKAPAEEVMLRVMLFPNKVVKETLGENARPLVVKPWPLALYTAKRSKSKQIFDVMNTTGSAKHFREFIGEAYRFKLITRTSSKGRKFNDLDLKSTLAAVDEETGKQLMVPEVPEDKLLLFTFNKPLKDMWDKLEITGTREDGTSKNFIQDKIKSALNFPGSDVEALLKGQVELDTSAPSLSNDDLPEPPADDEY